MNKFMLRVTDTLNELLEELKKDYGLNRLDITRFGILLAYKEITRKNPTPETIKVLAAGKDEESSIHKTTFRVSASTKHLLETLALNLECSQSQAIRIALSMLGKQMGLK